VASLFAEADNRLGEPDVVLYNASARAHVRVLSSTRKPCAKRSRSRHLAGFSLSSRRPGA
jgi:hypothetical protein